MHSSKLAKLMSNQGALFQVQRLLDFLSELTTELRYTVILTQVLELVEHLVRNISAQFRSHHEMKSLQFWQRKHVKKTGSKCIFWRFAKWRRACKPGTALNKKFALGNYPCLTGWEPSPTAIKSRRPNCPTKKYTPQIKSRTVWPVAIGQPCDEPSRSICHCF